MSDNRPIKEIVQDLSRLFSQKEIAKRLNVSTRTIRRWKKGETEPRDRKKLIKSRRILSGKVSAEKRRIPSPIKESFFSGSETKHTRYPLKSLDFNTITKIFNQHEHTPHGFLRAVIILDDGTSKTVQSSKYSPASFEQGINQDIAKWEEDYHFADFDGEEFELVVIEDWEVANAA